jgi:hypothetical protein
VTIDAKVVKGHCPNCGAGRKANVRCEHVVNHPDEGDGTAASDTGMILECCGCERVYFRRDYWFSESETFTDHPVTGELMMTSGVETKYWPAEVSRPRPKWLKKIEESDRDLGSLLGEMYVALDNSLSVVSAIAVRTVFDRSSELLGIDPANSFQEKLDRLCANGKISIDEEDTLEVLVDAGSAAAHRGWRPNTEELNTMIDVLESFLHRSFIVGDGIAKLKSAVPSKPKRASQGRPN